MIAADPLPTFRDPAGSLTLEPNRALRVIHPSARLRTLGFLHSPLCRRLQAEGTLIAATIDDTPNGLRLLHPRIPVPTYPWEWTSTQWQAAANLTLTLCEQALAEGYILKDATPLNILFPGPQPILVDILSFEPHDPASPVWLAYAQFIRTFLLPLVMHRLLHWPLVLTLFHRDGLDPATLYAALPWPKRLSPAAFWPITLPVWLETIQALPRQTPQATPPKITPEKAAQTLRKNLKDLRRRIAATQPTPRASTWSGYDDNLTHYTPEQKQQKLAWITQTLSHLKPTRTLDLGANTGEYSALAAAAGAHVIALERDEAAADRLFRMSRDRNLPIQTIHADLARPTPAAGWDNRESLPLLARLEGRCDLVLMLALIHHLLLIEQIPLPAILALAARLTTRFLIIEWVPATDPMYRALMRGRDALYASLAEADLHAATATHFTQRQRHDLSNGRILFLFEKLPHRPTHAESSPAV